MNFIKNLFLNLILILNYSVFLIKSDTSILKIHSLHNNNSLNFKHSSNPRIIGGSDVTEQNFPFMVSLVHYGAHYCGGSIINSKTILTAAHCVLFSNLRFLKVRVGSKYRSKDGNLYPIDSVVAHEKFDIITMDYDIGLARLKDKLLFENNNFIKPIKLQNANEIITDGTKAVVIGWGVINLNVNPDTLQYLQIDIMNNDDCNKYMGNLITNQMLCAGDIKGGHDSCSQDSGGPLLFRNTQIGIVSWGLGCAKPKRLGVYTNISRLRPWIEDTLFAVYTDKLPDFN